MLQRTIDFRGKVVPKNEGNTRHAQFAATSDSCGSSSSSSDDNGSDKHSDVRVTSAKYKLRKNEPKISEKEPDVRRSSKQAAHKWGIWKIPHVEKHRDGSS